MSKIAQSLWAEGREKIVVQGSFAPNGSSAVASASNRGKGWTVARTSAGVFTITFNEVYYQLDSAVATLQLATAADQYALVGTYTVGSASTSSTLVINVWDVSGAALSDIAADANNRVNFVCVFSMKSYQ